MALPTPAVDLHNFRLSKLREEQYRHMWWLLFWPVYLLRYLLLSIRNPVSVCTPVHCALDDRIPFLEGFVLFYVLWYVFIIGMHVFLMLYDVPGFRRYTKFLIVSISISTLAYLLYPTCQELRPTAFPRDNPMTWLVGLIYSVDANSNVCPSEHVIGALAVAAAAMHTKSIPRLGKAVILLFAVLISASTVFIKQHSAVDVFAAIPVCAIAYVICYGTIRKR